MLTNKGRHRITRGRLASAGIVAAGVAALVLGALSIIGDASPRSIVGDSTPRAALAAHVSKSGPVILVESKDMAGYATTRWVRTNSVTFTLPTGTQCAEDIAPRSPQGAGDAITLGPAEQATTGVPLTSGAATALGVSYVPTAAGCGLISPAFNSNLSGTTVLEPLENITLNPGDNVTLQLFYNTTGHFTTGVVIDNTTGDTAHGSFDGKATYEGGSVTAGFGPYTPQGGKYKFAAFKGGTVKTYTNHAGTLESFAPQAIDMTSNGASNGTLYAGPAAFWGASNFSVFVH